MEFASEREKQKTTMHRPGPAAVTRILFTALLLCYAASAPADPSQKLFEGDYFIHGLSLASGEVMPELKLHYRTLGSPTHDETGLITNAVLLLHGAGQDGETFLSEDFAGAIFGPGQPLDALHYFLILPDSIGSGKSSKPSEDRGLRFPYYSSEDIVLTQYRLVLEHLGVNHLRLIVGNTTGGGQAWSWGSTHPYFVDALVVIDCLASQPQWLAEVAHRGAEKIDADDDSHRQQTVAGNRPAIALEAVRAKVVAVIDESVLSPDRLAILQSEFARVSNGRYFVVPADHAGVPRGAISMVRKWKVILPELLESSESQ
jgi:homoserine acetyltransferase